MNPQEQVEQVAREAAKEYAKDYRRPSVFADGYADSFYTGFLAAATHVSTQLTHLQSENARLVKALSRVKDHVQYLRHAEKRYLEAGKEKYAWAKLNGPLSAIESELSQGEKDEPELSEGYKAFCKKKNGPVVL